MSIFIDLTGRKFNRLTVIERGKKNCGHHATWKCICECGNIKDIRGDGLRNGTVQSCGCLNKEINSEKSKTHGLSGHRFFKTWQVTVCKCYNTSHNSYKNYGGRGIEVCEEWKHEPSKFLAWCDKYEKDHGKIPETYSLERIDNNGNYIPENCRFASKAEQNRNQRTNVWVEYNNEILCITDCLRKYGKVDRRAFYTRLRRGWSFEEALLTPTRLYPNGCSSLLPPDW